MDNLVYWLWLTLGRDLAPQKIINLVGAFGSAKKVFEAGEAEYKSLGFLNEKNLSRLKNKNLAKAKGEWRRCARLGIALITFFDREYPPLLKEIGAPPALLYVRGDIGVFQKMPSIAFVGSRRSSVYGMTTTLDMARALAARGFVIVSGLAVGIDAAAHKGAMMAGGRTVAVLGCGMDVPYPRDNQDLKEDIIKSGGAVISELPLKSAPVGANFPVRNRIISGLSMGVAVVEAGAKSGALLTAGHAAEQGRDVFAVPGSINSPTAGGVNALIKDGAILLDKPEIIIEEYMGRYGEMFERAPLPPARAEKAGTATQTAKTVSPLVAADRPGECFGQSLADECKLETGSNQKGGGEQKTQESSGRPAHNELLKHIKAEPISVDELCRKTGMPAGEVNAGLFLLVVERKIKELPGRQYIKAD